MSIVNKYFADKTFYQKTAKIAVPLSLQSLLQSSVGIVDTIMVSWIGMVSAVGTAAQIDTIAGMVCYGIVGGTGIFTSQFFGANDQHNQKRSFGLCLLLTTANAIFWILIASLFGREILMFYLPDETVVGYGLEYLAIFKWSMLFGAVAFSFSNTYRSTHQTKVPLLVSIISSLTNIILNYLLIFGIGFFPKLGVQGAAYASIIASMLSIVLYLIHAIKTKQSFIGSFKEMFGLDPLFYIPILKKVAPLVINEMLFGFGSTLFIKAFGQLGTTSMDAYYVANQIFNLFMFCVYGYGAAVQILLGTTLGAGKRATAIKESNYHLSLSFIMSITLVILMIVFAPFMVSIFNLQDAQVNHLAILLVYVFAVKTSLRLFNFIIFSILKSGGDAKIIQFLDAGLVYLVGLPLAYISVYYLKINSIVIVFLICQLEQLIRFILGLMRVKKYYWASNLNEIVD